MTLLVPGGMRTGTFDGRDERCRPGPDDAVSAPDDAAAAVLSALAQPPGCAVRDLVVCPALESSYP